MTEPTLSKPPTDYGWANNWKEDPEAVKKCNELKHKKTDVDVGRPPGRGYENVVTCEICNIVYRYDSSG
jgi:hypothetical protein